MKSCKGIIHSVVQWGGCVEVTVVGKQPGTFAIDHCCVWSIVDIEGADWIDRRVEYVDGCMRFLDLPRRRRRCAKHWPGAGA